MTTSDRKGRKLYDLTLTSSEGSILFFSQRHSGYVDYLTSFGCYLVRNKLPIYVVGCF